jgi:hypothetical protein
MNKEGILINAHFDSVPGSPGASDDGVGVAVMLEIIRAITSRYNESIHRFTLLFADSLSLSLSFSLSHT